MYFRLPLIILFGFGCIGGFLMLQGHFEKAPVAKGETISKNVADKPVVENESFNSIQAKDLQAHLEFLADDLLEGRDTGSRGARIAAMYISSHFERYGLKPLGKNGSYFQDVELNKRLILPTSRVFVEVDGEMVPLKYKKDFVVTGVPVNSGGEIAEEMVFTGFGIKADEYNYNDYIRVNAAKKISVYVTGEPYSEDDKDFFKGKERTKYSEGDLKRQAAKAAGALGAVSILRNQHMEHFSWGLLESYLTKPQISLKTELKATDQVTNF